MDREILLTEIQKYINSIDKLSPSEYMYGIDKGKSTSALCPAFGYHKGGKDTARIDLDIYKGTGHMHVNIRPDDGSGQKILFVGQMTDTQLEAISALLHRRVIELYTESQKAASNPRLKDILPVIGKWADKCAKAAGPEFKAYLDYGKRANDDMTRPYHAIVVEKDGWQMGTIPLRQDGNGLITYNVQKVLGGQWDRDRVLPMKDCISCIREAMGDIVHKRLMVDSMPARMELQDTVLAGKGQELDKLMNIDVQTRRYNSWLPMGELNHDGSQKWRIGFEHHFETPEKATVNMVAQQLDDKRQEWHDIAHGTVNPQDPTRAVVLTGYADDYPEIIGALVKSGKVKSAGEYAERHQDYPGAEMEQFNWHKLDVTDLYRHYVQLRNAQYLFSPLDNLSVSSRYGDGEWDFEKKYWMDCKLAGIHKLANEVRRALDAQSLIHSAQAPLYGFVLQEAAHKAFAPELHLMNEAMKRMSDVTCHVIQSGIGQSPHIRCRIDGEQQMSISIGHELMEECNRAADPELAWRQLAALFYQKELSQTQDRSQSMKR